MAAPQQSLQQKLRSYTSGSAYKEVIGPAMYEEIREGGRSELARAKKTLEEKTRSTGNHQIIGSYVEMLGRKRKRGNEVDEGTRHKLPKHDYQPLVGEMRAAIVSLKDKGIHLMKYPRMRKVKSGLSDRLVSLSIRGFRGQRLEYFEMLRRLRPKVVMVQETLVKRKDWAITIPGYEVFQDCAREGPNHGVLLGIYKGHVAQKIPGIEGKLLVAQAQLY
ncbi:hypothetical protein AYI69_g11467 [Smittium culicis]|uniref:Uncharacterized protein n=1 Tax=Smittium culicis TaxID=133412 RepID=A0A1R1WYE7_9FUNG|nr:hypothetical protein AYI69_g11467 [Smittium culicis]